MKNIHLLGAVKSVKADNQSRIRRGTLIGSLSVACYSPLNRLAVFFKNVHVSFCTQVAHSLDRRQDESCKQKCQRQGSWLVSNRHVQNKPYKNNNKNTGLINIDVFLRTRRGSPNKTDLMHLPGTHSSRQEAQKKKKKVLWKPPRGAEITSCGQEFLDCAWDQSANSWVASHRQEAPASE